MIHRSHCLNSLIFLTVILFLGLAFAFPFSSRAQGSREKTTEARIAALVARMTPEEKAGQLNLLSSNFAVTGPTISKDYIGQIERGQVGGVFNAFGSAFTRKLQTIAVKNTRLHIPLLFGFDVIHGFKTIFPMPLAEAASWDTAAIRLSAAVAARESAVSGLHWTFAPMVDIARDPRWGRIVEGAGEDTWLGSLIAAARVRGFQQKGIGDPHGVIACVKHFAAYGAVQAGRDYNTVDVSERSLRETYLPPFKAALDAGAGSIMPAFNDLNGIPCSANSFLLKKILRDEWKFKGFVVSDYTAVQELIPHGLARDAKDAGMLSFNAGMDMDMVSEIFIKQLPGLLAEGKIKETDLDRAVSDILRAKYQLGLFDDPYKYCHEGEEKAELFSASNRAASRKVARRSIVLLKNTGDVLPIQRSVKRIAVIGELANSRHDMIGSWSGAGDTATAVSLYEGLKRRFGNTVEISYARGCGISDSSRQGFAAAVSLAAGADMVIYAAGEASQSMTGEASSKTSLNLPGIQSQLLDALAATGTPVVLLIMSGRPLTIEHEVNKSTAVLETWFLGSEGGNAIADVLSGDYSPQGKLPVTFPLNVGQIPLYYNSKNTGRPRDDAAEGKYRSKYLDSPDSALFPFGYGLTYTSFSFSGLRVSSPQIRPDEVLKVNLLLTNTGKREGEETVQLYIRQFAASVTRPVKELRNFRKVVLKPGESRTVEFDVPASRDFAFYNANMKYSTEPGRIQIMVGPDSRHLQGLPVELLPQAGSKQGEKVPVNIP